MLLAEELCPGWRSGRKRGHQDEAWQGSTSRVHKEVIWSVTTGQRRSDRRMRRPSPQRRVQKDPDPELLTRLLRRDAVLIQHAGEVVVARHGDERVHILRRQLAPHNHRVPAAELPELLVQTFTQQKRNHTSSGAEFFYFFPPRFFKDAWTVDQSNLMDSWLRTVESDGTLDGEDAGVASDVAQLAVVATGDDPATVAAE